MPAIHNYSYKPTPNFQHVGRAKRTTIYLGWELEFELCRMDSESTAETIIEKMQRLVYCKCDGSLDHGLEIVSHPMSYEWIQANAEMIEGTLKWLSDSGAKSYDTTTCGLHVHVGRNALTGQTLNRMMEFVYSNPTFMHKISRRRRSNLNHWAQVHVNDHERSHFLNIQNKDKTRRMALNTIPPRTVEFRLFKGTLKFSSFMRAIETCHAIVEFCKGDGELRTSEFALFVRRKRETYPNLFQFMQKIFGVKPRSRASSMALA